MTLVRGMTDILTPINLLPNSNFSRTGGVSTSGTFSTMSAGSDYKICERVTLYEPTTTGRGTLSNITYSINNGVLTISGTCSAANGITYLWVKNRISLKPGIYSTGYDVSGKSSTINVSHSGYPDNMIRIYANDADKTQEAYQLRDVTSLTANNTFTVVQTYINASNTSVNFTFKISNWYVYEGAFCNPPITVSLDVKPSNQFLCTDCSNLYLLTNYNPLRTTARINRAGWVRLLRFYAPEATINEYWELLMCKTYNWGKPFMSKIKLWMLLRDQNDQVGIDVEQPYLNGDRIYNYAFQSYRVTKSSTETYVYHFEGQLAAQVNDIFTFRVLLGSVGNYLANDGIRMSSYLPTIPTDNTVNANDTVVTPGSYQVRRFGFNFAS